MTNYSTSKKFTIYKTVILFLTMLLTIILFLILNSSDQENAVVLLCVAVFALPISLLLIIEQLIIFMRNRLMLGEETIVMKQGVLNISIHEIPYKKINSITINKDLIDMIIGTGKLIISTGSEVKSLVFSRLHDPELVKDQINKKINEGI